MDIKCQYCWTVVQEEGECKDCHFKLNREPRFLEWEFYYKVYPKQRAIQLKPHHDKTNHFSIIWTKDRKTLTPEILTLLDKTLRDYITVNGNVLHFRIIRACKNCTYGRFEQEFEDKILDMRKQYPFLSRIKDLTLDDPKHQFLKEHEVWDEDHPIIHHIHSESDNPVWVDFMRNSSRNSVLTLKITPFSTFYPMLQ